MATARKLPSGSWRCRVYDYTDTSGVKHYRSFTSDDSTARGKLKAEAMANKFMLSHEEKRSELTFGQACDAYIADRAAVCSSTTINSYKGLRNTHFDSLSSMLINNIRQSDIQSVINIMSSKGSSPKTVRNAHGLISAVLRVYRPQFALNTTLPKVYKPDLYIPTDKDVEAIMKRVHGTAMELPILLAAFGPMRRGEICALESTDISGSIVHVQRNMVKGKDNKEWTIKKPKSVTSDRFIEYPDFVAALWKDKSGRVVNMTPNVITNRFIRLLDSLGLPHFRFHDLRHYCASVQHAMGIPDAYIMSRGGWGSDAVLKNIYRHAMSDRQEQMNKIANDHFSQMYDTIYDTNEKERPFSGRSSMPAAGLEPVLSKSGKTRKSTNPHKH